MSGYIDGDFSNAFLSANVVSFPLADKPNNSNVACFELTFYQWANTYTPAALGSNVNYAPNAYLVDQSQVQRVGAGVVKFTRTYCQLPFTWYDIEPVQYSYPGLDRGVGTTNYVAAGLRQPITMLKTATVKHEYTVNANVPYANVVNVTTVTLAGQPINRIGQAYFGNVTLTVPNVDPTTWVISSDPTRWRGPIWEIITKTVSAPNVFP